MAWLSDWEKRIELTIDDTNVDSDMTNFPVLVYLSAASGIGDVDASPVFDELTSDANRKKIAVTSSNGTTQLYVEIERWDDANEKAWLWVKVPSILATGGATLYLYYDSTKADNTTYIGDIGSTPGQSVWDENFVGVWHMAQDPNGDGADAIKDSTSNANHGTPSGSMTSADLVDGLIGKCIDFDGGDDYITLGTVTISSAWTAEVTSDPSGSTTSGDGFILFDGKGIVQAGGYWSLLHANDVRKKGSLLSVTGDFLNIAATFDGSSTYYMYEDGVENSSDNTNSGWGLSGVYRIASGYLSRHPEGKIDEIRLSNIERSAAWLKATHYSNTDALITFGSEATYSEDIIVTLTQHFSVNCNLSATLKIGIPLTSALSVQTIMSAEIGWKVFAEPLSVNFSMSIGNIVCIWRELLDRDSRITTVLEDNSPITKTLVRDSLISDLTENSILGT